MTVSAVDISAEEAAVAKVEQKSKASDRRATWAMPARLKLKSGSSLSVTGTENASLFPLPSFSNRILSVILDRCRSASPCRHPRRRESRRSQRSIRAGHLKTGPA